MTTSAQLSLVYSRPLLGRNCMQKKKTRAESRQKSQKKRYEKISFERGRKKERKEIYKKPKEAIAKI